MTSWERSRSIRRAGGRARGGAGRRRRGWLAWILLLTTALVGLVAVAHAADGDPEPSPEWWKALRLRGRIAEEFAYRLHDPGDYSKLRTTGWLDAKYAFSEAVSLRVATRAWYDAVFDITDRYPPNVERDQKTELALREALLSVSWADLDVRLGRQQIVWGEAISTFVTDIVNPKDFREFILPDFSELRIPIWALDFAYHLREGLTFEGVWTPDTRSNKLAKQGGEFQFAPIPFQFHGPVVRLPDDADEFSLSRSEGGFRLSELVNGWDLSLIYYDQNDKTSVLFQRKVTRPVGPAITVLEPRHPRVHIVGFTLGKTIEPFVIRAEAAYSIGKQYETLDPADADGVVRRDTLDYLIGIGATLFSIDTTLQVSQKILAGSAANVSRVGVEGQVTTSLALRLSTAFLEDTLITTLLFVVNTNMVDYRVSPKIDYLVSGSVTLSVGVDIFEGTRHTLYGQFDRNDRGWFTANWRF
jgi:hypothetical protein